MNQISEEKRWKLFDCFVDYNLSIREAARRVGVAKETAHRVRKAINEVYNDDKDSEVRFMYQSGREFKMIHRPPI